MSMIEDGQGNVQINFEPRKEHPRRSYSASTSNSFLEIRIPSRRSNVHSNLEEVDYSSTIPNLKYSRIGIRAMFFKFLMKYCYETLLF